MELSPGCGTLRVKQECVSIRLSRGAPWALVTAVPQPALTGNTATPAQPPCGVTDCFSPSPSTRLEEGL